MKKLTEEKMQFKKRVLDARAKIKSKKDFFDKCFGKMDYSGFTRAENNWKCNSFSEEFTNKIEKYAEEQNK